MKLDNNINTLIVSTDNKKVISIIYKIKCGFNNEYKGINNYTHLLEHLIATYLNTEQCSIEAVRKHTKKKILNTNAYTEDNEVCFWIECYYKDVDFFIDLMSRSLFDLCITTENLNMAKKNVIKELEQSDERITALFKTVERLEQEIDERSDSSPTLSTDRDSSGSDSSPTLSTDRDSSGSHQDNFNQKSLTTAKLMQQTRNKLFEEIREHKSNDSDIIDTWKESIGSL